jgi:nicotinamide riboside kinase
MEQNTNKELIRVVVTGPESTGKTKISDYLAMHFNALWVPEFARYYISSLRDKYTYADVETIARQQVNDYHRYSAVQGQMIIFDTWLIITKVWFQTVYNKYPVWIDEKISSLPVDLYLLCAPDIPWEPDDVRENGGETRMVLFDRYLEEIKKTGAVYHIIRGSGQERFDSAVNALNSFILTRP